ncbi:uncharacterized protein LOC133194837 [Saccostrea echinata]|uniref:uncharacterized protein LOC133194837 n=1 Tax=Saccostrea echinata TaxID=191078 RepID=UPI002A807626|nr:uncharacterized protein LOC133194837 [Saccostrea echinata]
MNTGFWNEESKNEVLYSKIMRDVLAIVIQQNEIYTNEINRLQREIKQLRKDVIAKAGNNSHSSLKCESGVLGIHKSPPPTWPYTQVVSFRSPFREIPALTYGLYRLDVGHRTNLRVNTVVMDITNRGFNVRLQTWGDTILYGANISWMACGG